MLGLAHQQPIGMVARRAGAVVGKQCRIIVVEREDARVRRIALAFASVMDSVKRAGVTNISIVTQPYER